MILTDREIQAALHAGRIAIIPEPGPEAFSSTSVDLTLSPLLKTWNDPPIAGTDPRVFCPASPEFRYAEIAEKLTQPHELDADGFVVKPGQLVLAWTREEILLPKEACLAARVEGKSSLARLGIGVHVTAPTIHAGFEGPLQLEVCNQGPLHVRLVPGMKVCQLILEQTFGTPESGYKGQFYRQHGK